MEPIASSSDSPHRPQSLGEGRVLSTCLQTLSPPPVASLPASHSRPRLPMRQGGARSCQHPRAVLSSDSWSRSASCSLSHSPGPLCTQSSRSLHGDLPSSFLLCLPSLLPSPKAQLLLPFREIPGTPPPPPSPPNLKPGARLSPFPLRK